MNAPPLRLTLSLATMAKAAQVRAIDTERAGGMSARVYKNLHNGKWSMKGKDGIVAGHADHVTMKDVQFRVSEAGRQRVVREKKKNVHAVVHGTVHHVDDAPVPEHAVPVSYNPYRAGHFYRKDTGEAVHHADEVHMRPHGVFAVNPR